MGQMPTKRDTPSLGRPVWGQQLKLCIQILGTMQCTSYRSSAPELQRQSFKILFKHQNITLNLISLHQASLLSLPLGFNCLQSWKHQNIPSVDELSPGILLLFKSKLGFLRRDWGSLDHAGRVCCVCSTTSQQQMLGSCLEGVWYQVRN